MTKPDEVYVVNPKVRQILDRYYEGRWAKLSAEQQAEILRKGMDDMAGEGLRFFRVSPEMQRQSEKIRAEGARNRASMADIADALTALFVEGEGGVVGWTVTIARTRKGARVLWREEVVDVQKRECGARLFFHAMNVFSSEPKCLYSRNPMDEVERRMLERSPGVIMDGIAPPAVPQEEDGQEAANEPGSWVDVDHMSGSCRDGARTADGGFTFISSDYRFTLTPPTTST